MCGEQRDIVLAVEYKQYIHVMEDALQRTNQTRVHARGWTTIEMDVDAAADAARATPSDSDDGTAVGSPNRVGEFPTGIPCLDDMVARPEILNSVQQLLQTSDVRLLQADVWGKKGGIDQRIHQDYGNNTFLLPQWNTPEAVAVIVYYSDNKGGETHVVSRKGDDDPAYKDVPASSSRLATTCRS